MAHQTHLYAAISSGTVTAQTFEQLPTAIIKKKKTQKTREMSGFVCIFFLLRKGRRFGLFITLHWVTSCTGSTTSGSDSCILPCRAQHPPPCNKASHLPYIAEIQPSSKTYCFKETEKRHQAISNCFVTSSWCRCYISELSRAVRYLCRCLRVWETALCSYTCWRRGGWDR